MNKMNVLIALVVISLGSLLGLVLHRLPYDQSVTLNENVVVRAVQYCQGPTAGDSDATQGSIDYLEIKQQETFVMCDNGANVTILHVYGDSNAAK